MAPNSNNGSKPDLFEKLLGFKLVDDKPIMDQVHVFENLCTDIVNEGMKLDDIFMANVLLVKFPSTWNEYRNRLKHKKKDMPLQEMISHIRTEEANQLKDKVDFVAQISTNVNLVETGGPSNINRTSGLSVQAAKITPQANIIEADDVIAFVVVEVNLVANASNSVLDTEASNTFALTRRCSRTL
ncbi:hypothetical protein LIER_15700 [Lithospermum erythrorhizon]|uniref:Uncharacterized protein n=1 Tax=Lithospermum erythrorhizon TaxID=34254 RepID=A0AAV3Q4A0_LITER